MFTLQPRYSCTVAVMGSVGWLQAADSYLVKWGGTVSQPNFAELPPGVSEPRPRACPSPLFLPKVLMEKGLWGFLRKVLILKERLPERPP